MVWDAVSGNPQKFTKWPNPFTNMVGDITVLACENTWQAMFTMYGIAFGNWFWSSFIPSPVEIARKTFTGSYKCGFYSKYKVRSPLDVIWRDGRTSRTLGQIIRPVTTGAFYLWAGQTIWDALQTWQSLEYAMEMCDWDGNTTTIRDGSAPIQASHTAGSPAFGEILYDPRNRGNESDCFVEAPGITQWQAYFIGRFVTQAETLTNVKVGITVNGVQQNLQDLGTIGPFSTVSFAAEAQGIDTNLVVQGYFECDSTTISIDFSNCFLDRLIVNAFPLSFPWEPNKPLPLLQIVPGGGSPPFDPLCQYYE